jgi:hypothetical protein
MPYAITSKGWRNIQEDWQLAEGESYVDELPEWLLLLAEQQQAEADVKIDLDSRLNEANKIIQPLQDDYDIGEITEEDLTKWKAWKRYRSALSKTPDRDGWLSEPDWPSKPD